MSDDPQQNPAAQKPNEGGQAKPDQLQNKAPDDGNPNEAKPDGADDADRGADDSIRRAAAAANNPGSTTAKRRQRTQSRRNLNVGTSSSSFDNVTAYRDIAGRDVVNIYAGVSQVDGTFEISAEARATSRHRYVRPSCFDTLVSFCANRSVTIIRVVAGQGKLATAVRVADETCPGPLYRLDHKGDLDSLCTKEIAQGAGYVLTSLDQGQVNATLTRHALARVATALEASEARLIIAVGVDTRLGQLKSADFVTELAEAPALRDVLGVHLRDLIDADRADGLLAAAEISKLLDAELTSDASVRHAVLLAVMLADACQAAGAHDAVAADVRTRLASRKQSEFADWFEQLGGLDKYGFVVALAVLNGLSYEVVADAGRRLENRLTTPLHGNVEDLPRDQVQPFRSSLSARLREFDARLTSGHDSAVDGLPTQVVEFNDPERPRRLLAHMWREYGDAHAAVVDWLRELGGHRMEEVRTRAGVAAGMLASVALDFLQHNLIERWAASKNPLFRETAAIAVDATNAIPALKDQARGIAKDWCSSGETYLTAAGIRVYGSSVGLDRPAELFEALDQQAESDHPAILDAVCASLLELAEAGVNGVSDRAVMTTKKWVGSRNNTRRFTGGLAFLWMAGDLLFFPDGAPAAAATVNHRDHWPLLLRLSEHSDEWRAVIAHLWAATLFNSETAEAAVAVLDKWAESAEADSTRRAAFVRLLRVTVTSNRVLARIRRAVKTWADPGNAVPAPLTASALADIDRVNN